MTVSVDVRRYGRLLAKVQPRVIESEEENDRMLAVVERLLDRGEERLAEEVELTKLVVRLIEDFEERRYVSAGSTPLSRLQALMEEHQLKQKDLVDEFGSKGIASEILAGKREMSKAHARRLGERFHVSPALFLVD